MAKLLTAVIALATLGGLAYYVMYSRSPAATPAAAAPGAVEDVGSVPHQQLENVRAAAKRIEADDARRAEEVMKKVDSAEAQ